MDLDLFIVGGQSNAVGKGKASESPTPPSGTAYEWTTSNGLVDLDDPVGTGINEADTGSAWPQFGVSYYEATGSIPVIVQAAVGGTAQVAAADSGDGNWDESGSLRDDLLTSTQDAVSSLRDAGHDVTLCGLLWCQGYLDANQIDNGPISVADYKAAFRTMREYYRSNLLRDLPVYILQTGTPDTGPTTGFLQIQRAQMEFDDLDPRTFVVCADAKTFAAQGLMSDSAHYTQPAYNSVGESAANTISGLTL